MILVLAKQKIKPENVDEFQKFAKIVVEEANKEEGCVADYIVQSQDDPLIHVFVEIWKNQEALDLHLKSEKLYELGLQLVPTIDGEQTAEKYNIL